MLYKLNLWQLDYIVFVNYCYHYFLLQILCFIYATEFCDRNTRCKIYFIWCKTTQKKNQIPSLLKLLYAWKCAFTIPLLRFSWLGEPLDRYLHAKNQTQLAQWPQERELFQDCKTCRTNRLSVSVSHQTPKQINKQLSLVILVLANMLAHTCSQEAQTDWDSHFLCFHQSQASLSARQIGMAAGKPFQGITMVACSFLARIQTHTVLTHVHWLFQSC